MSAELRLRHEEGRHVEILTDAGALLWRYVYFPDTRPGEAPRPYAHPVCSLDGDVLTNFRPNDHPWHHGLSMTLTSVGGVNFWGGPSYRAVDGYQWRDDHGVQRHQSWESLTPGRMEERIGWYESKSGEALLQERRVLETTLHHDGWSLRWDSELSNITQRELRLDNYHSGGGLVGSHYTGLQFRGARDLLDEHGDAAIGITADGDRSGEAAVHGATARWMEWACQHDGSLRRTRIRFESLTGEVAWFVRTKNPVAAFAFHREVARAVPERHVLRLSHQLTFTRA